MNQHKIVTNKFKSVLCKFKLAFNGLKAQHNLLLDLQLDHIFELLGRLLGFIFFCKLFNESVH